MTVTGATVLSASVLGLVLAACGGLAPLQVEQDNAEVQRVPLASLGGIGLSGTAMDADGELWAVAEKERVLCRLEESDEGMRYASQIPIVGLPDGVEAESLAWLEEDVIIIGTESREEDRDEDHLFIADVREDGAVVRATLTLSWRALWGFGARSNQGIEGLCFADGVLVAAGEPVIAEGGARYAPIARYGPDPGRGWTAFRLELTSEEGKISSLDCHDSDRDGYLELVAIERHYGVARLLRFDLPTRGQGGTVRPAVVLDLSERLDPMPNLEGLSRTEEGGLFIMTDHDPDDTTGTTEEIFIGPIDEDD